MWPYLRGEPLGLLARTALPTPAPAKPPALGGRGLPDARLLRRGRRGDRGDRADRGGGHLGADARPDLPSLIRRRRDSRARSKATASGLHESLKSDFYPSRTAVSWG